MEVAAGALQQKAVHYRPVSSKHGCSGGEQYKFPPAIYAQQFRAKGIQTSVQVPAYLWHEKVYKACHMVTVPLLRKSCR